MGWKSQCAPWVRETEPLSTFASARSLLEAKGRAQGVRWVGARTPSLRTLAGPALTLIVATGLTSGCAPSDPDPTLDGGLTDGPQPGRDAAVPDGGDADGGDLDGGLTTSSVTVRGRVVPLADWVAGRDAALADSLITPVGAAEAPSTTTDGHYQLTLPPSGSAFVRITHEPDHAPSFLQLRVADQDVEGELLVIAARDHLDALGAAFGLSLVGPCDSAGTCIHALLVVQVVDRGLRDSGEAIPVSGVLGSGFSLQVQGLEDWRVRGPLFLAPDGAANPGATATQIGPDSTEPSKTRGGFALFAIETTSSPPTIAVTLRASRSSGTSVRHFGPLETRVAGGALTFARLKERAAAPEPIPPADELEFDAHIYPLLLREAHGGLGCLTCHVTEPPRLGGGAAAAYAALRDPAHLRVRLEDPRESLLLTRPLFSSSAGAHPNFTFASEYDTAFRTMLAWIAAGARRTEATPPPPPRVSFRTEVLPLLRGQSARSDIACTQCHSGSLASWAGGLAMDASPEAVHTALTAASASDDSETQEPFRVNRSTPHRSLLLTNPLASSPEQHAVKPFANVEDEAYRLLLRWITEGAEDDPP